MKRFLAALCVAFAFSGVSLAEDAIGHMVFFELKDNSPTAQKKLVDACKKLLANHEGTLYFSAGPRDTEFQSPFNAKDFDVALHLVFKDKKSYDKYHDHADHTKFVDESKENWKGVKVFDSRVSAPAK